MDALDSILKIEERLVAKATNKNIPIGGTFELLPLCNMNCDMCYIRLSKEQMQQVGQIKTADQWLELAKEMKQAGTIFILLTGGEPLLYPEFKKLYTGLKKLGMIITINTNGTLITEDIAAFLSKDKPRRINITLYGASDETYSKLCHNPKGFTQTIKGIKLLQKYNLDIKLNGTLVPQNQNDMPKLLELAKELDLYLKIDTYIFPSSRKRIRPFLPDSRLSAKQAALQSLKIKKKTYTKEKFQQYQKHMLNHPKPNIHDCSLNCRAGKSSFWISWDGYLSPCVFIDQPAINVFNEGFLPSWNQLITQTKQLHLPPDCIKCDNYEICQVCGASVYLENNNYDDKPQYMCTYTKTILEELKNMENNNENN